MNSINNKRKNRNTNSISNPGGGGGGHGVPINKSNRGKNNDRHFTGPSHSNSQVEGIYMNERFMHSVTSLVGCVVHVQVKDGTLYEGVLRTFSPEFDLVLEMVAKVDIKALTPNCGKNVGCLLESLKDKQTISDTMIFNLQNVVVLNVSNVDLEYATRGHFTDTEISRFDSQALNKSKDLVPWEEPVEEYDAGGLEESNPGITTQNGWDANDMFKVNEEKFKVHTTYDSSLEGYTVPLVVQDTAEYKLKEAEAAKIAQDIESDLGYKDRISKEDGDEEEKYSAVVRPVNDHPPSHQSLPRQNNRRKNLTTQNNSVISINTDRGRKGTHNNSPSISSPTSFHGKHQQSSSSSYNANKSSSTSSPQSSQSAPHKTLVSKDETHLNKLPLHQQQPVSQHQQNHSQIQQTYSRNDGGDNTGIGSAPMQNQPPLPQRSEVRTTRGSKRCNEIAEYKQFSSTFKLTEENIQKESAGSKDNNSVHKQEQNLVKSDQSSPYTPDKEKVDGNVESKTHLPQKQTPQQTQTVSTVGTPESDTEQIAKKSTLNPMAQEFTPCPKPMATSRPLVVSTPINVGNTLIGVHGGHHVHQQQQQQQQQQQHHHQHHQHQQQQHNRMHSPLVAFPPQFVPQTLQFVAPNQYLVPNMQVPPPFQPNNATSNSRFRGKGSQQYQTQNNRHEYSQSSAQVAAATGHPVLATAPQMQVPYAPSQGGVVPTSGPHQVAYPTVYPIHPRMNMMSPQVGVMPHQLYDPNLQHIYMTNVGHLQLQPTLLAQAAVAAQQNVSSGQHSAPSTPQSGTPTTPLHGGPPTPSPVHHQGVPTQPPTPTPQQVIYGSVQSHSQTPVSVHSNTTGPFGQHVMPIILPGQGMAPNQQMGGSGAHMHLSHNNPSPGNHHGGAPLTLVQTQGAIPGTHYTPNQPPGRI